MSIESQTPECNKPQQEQGETFSPTLDGFLNALQQEGVNTLPAEMIKKQLDDTGVAIVTRDFNCGIRISRSGSKSRSCQCLTWTTNSLKDPNHPLSQKFARKDIIIG
ncbi:MAG TPA: hypothetical protein ENI56_02700 [Candidatus Kaiserbacteria bacterium]|nr:hypothetical protein [Candidatus Kaiserbacteria bacterium]